MIFIDSNVLIDLFEDAEPWSAWSERALQDSVGQRVISQVVVAEVSPRFATLAKLIAFVTELSISVADLSAQAAFRAGCAHSAYRRAGGSRTGILADFLIGAHASVLGATLLTRDRQRFASYFPELTLITPEKHHG